MKKFNPEEELNKIQSSNFSSKQNKQLAGTFIPALVLACFGITILGVSISNSLTEETIKTYTISVDIINGQESQYIKRVTEGKFEAKIENDATFGSITCSEGYLDYDIETQTIHSSNIKEDTKCILAFMEDGTKAIQLSQLQGINDNTGKSYIFKGDAKNNYIKINNTMFRIVRINGDGTYRLITNDVIDTTTFGSTNEYEYSNIKNVLNSWIQELGIETEKEDYDVSNYKNITLENIVTFDKVVIENVGLLNIKEAYIINDKVENSYLDGSYFLSNGNGLYNVWSIVDNKITNINSNEENGIRPVINIKIDKLKGQGTEELPYEIG